MMKRLFFASFVLIFFSSEVEAQLRTNGYLSFAYLKGQEKSNVSQGSFQNVGAGLIFSGKIETKFDYAFELRAKEVTRVEVEQAWVGFKTSDVFKLRIGFFLVPFGKYNESNRPHETRLIGVPLNLEEIYPSSWREVGILVEGRLGFFLYSAYAGNGLAEGEELKVGQQFRDNNSDKAKGARIGLNLGKEMEIGYSYYRGKYDEGNERNLIIHGADLTWMSENFHLLFEYTLGHIENPAPFSTGKARGYYTLVSLNLGNFWPVVSYQDSLYEDPFHGLGFLKPDYVGRGISRESSRWALGLMYFATQNLLFKIEYDFNREREPALKDNVFLAQAALNF